MKDHLFKVVVIGGGFGGVKTALELANDKRCGVTLVAEHDELIVPPTSISLSHIFAGKAVKVIHDSPVGIDVSRKLIVGKSGQYQYDAVVLALGVVTNYFAIQGLENRSWDVVSPESLTALRRTLHDELIASKHSDTHYAIVGAGPAGVELAASLKEHLSHVAVRHGIGSPRVHIALVEAAPRILPRMNEKTSKKAAKRLHELGVKVYVNTRAKRLDDVTLSVGDLTVPMTTTIWTAGVTNHPFFKENSGVFHLNEHGTVIVNEYLEAAPGVFVIGDSVTTRYASLARTAVHDGRFVAGVIRARLSGKRPPLHLPRRSSTVVPLGHMSAVLERGKLRLAGPPARWLYRYSLFRRYYDILPPRRVLQFWLHHSVTEKIECELCQKNNDSSRVARSS